LADTALSFANVAQTATPVAPTGAVGVLVSSLMGGVTDADTADGKGMAITGADTANGKLFYSTNGGTTWTQVDTSTALSDARAFLIGSDADNRLYFQPNATSPPPAAAQPSRQRRTRWGRRCLRPMWC
jgi:hypothetical protein